MELRETRLDWLGEIPPHWGIVRLRRLTVGGTQNGLYKSREHYNDNGVPIVSMAEAFAEPEICTTATNRLYLTPKELHEYALKEGDLLFARRSLVFEGSGKCSMVGALSEPQVFESSIIRVTPDNNRVRPKFLFLYLASDFARWQVLSVTKQVTISGIDGQQLKDILVVLPPLTEQRAIADFLDRRTAAIDELIAKKERLIELLNEKRQALITQAVTRGLDPSVPMKDSGIEWLGEIPAHWEVKRLKHFLNPGIPLCYGILKPGPNTDNGVPYLGAGEVVPEKMRLDLLPRTTKEMSDQYPRTLMRPGELVYAIRGSYGNVEVLPRELAGCNLSRDAARIAPRRDIDSHWLCFALRSYASQCQFRYRAIGATITGVNIGDLRRVYLSLPPHDEQKRIASFLSTALGTNGEVLAKVKTQIEKFREYRQALISAAVTGKIDVRNEVTS